MKYLDRMAYQTKPEVALLVFDLLLALFAACQYNMDIWLLQIT